MRSETLALTGDDYEAVLRELGDHVVANDWADPEYVDALLEREENYPTGLQIPGENGTLGIAIPHADPDHVHQQAVVVGLPESSATFRSMDDKDEEIAVNAVVLLLVTEKEGYSAFLSNLTKLFQDDAFAERVYAKDGDALVEMILDLAVET
jgi:PTS system galactitol-specific IIA component